MTAYNELTPYGLKGDASKPSSSASQRPRRKKGASKTASASATATTKKKNVRLRAALAFERFHEGNGAASRSTEKRPLRVVHVGPCFTRGGAEQQIIDLARFVNPERVQIHKCLVTQANLIDPDVVADMPAPVEVADADTIRQAARESDVLMFWGMMLDHWLADCRPKLCVYLAHGDSHWTKELLVGSSQVTDHVIAVSHRVQEQVCDGFPTSVILNGIDSARLGQTRSRQEVRRQLGFGPDDFVLGYLGRLSPEKRPELLIDAVSRLPQQFKALLVGWGSLRDSLMQRANDQIPGRFAFVTANSHLGDYYQAMDAFCLLSVQEGFALVVLEAMMCQRPVIATPVGSVPEVMIDRVNGLVVDGSATAVRDAALLLQRHPHWAQAIGVEARRYAEQHGHALRMAREYETLLENLWRQKHAS